MSLCKDKSVDALKKLGYNVVRHPSVAIKPLSLIGRQGKESLYLGPLNLLITNPPGRLPKIEEDKRAADISGQSSSKLSLAIGANILGSLVGAMGGNLGVNTSYTDAQKVEFHYKDVFNDSVVPAEVGNYLKRGVVDADNLIFREYVLGNGELFVITKTAKSKDFTVKYERNNETAANVKIPALKDLVGGNVKVDAAGKLASGVSFAGKEYLVFGFQCFRVGVLYGEMTLTSVRAGGAVLEVTKPTGEKPSILNEDGLVDLEFSKS